MVIYLCSLIPLVVVAVLPASLYGLSLRDEVRSRPRRAIDQVKMLVDASYRNRQVGDGRLVMKDQLNLDAGTLALIQGHEVAIDPIQVSAIWAYRLNWRPFPVFQTYSAYAGALDELNAAALASSFGPDRILRQGPLYAIDGRYPLFESPAYQLSMICNFVDLYQTRRWEVLGRIHDRCSRPSLIGSVPAPAGRSVAVPRPRQGQLIYASMVLRHSLVDEFLAAMFKPPSPSILLDGHSYRFVAATASGPLVLCVPRVVAPPEYGGGVCPSTIAVRGVEPIEFRFYTIQVGPATTS
jgi:hypothetical protein